METALHLVLDIVLALFSGFEAFILAVALWLTRTQESADQLVLHFIDPEPVGAVPVRAQVLILLAAETGYYIGTAASFGGLFFAPGLALALYPLSALLRFARFARGAEPEGELVPPSQFDRIVYALQMLYVAAVFTKVAMGA